MITSPDPQTNHIFEALQNQRDASMVENGTLTARVKELEGHLLAITEAQTQMALPAPPVPDETPAN